jgi:hypothetical protein
MGLTLSYSLNIEVLMMAIANIKHSKKLNKRFFLGKLERKR